MKLVDELKVYGVSMAPDEFEELIEELQVLMFPSWSGEQLLYHPRDGVRYCEAIRARAGQGLPDEMILRRLNNIRKKATTAA